MNIEQLRSTPGRSRAVHLSVQAVAKMHGVHKQTALNAIEDGTLCAASYIVGPWPEHKVIAIGVTEEAARAWKPRKRGRPVRDQQLTSIPLAPDLSPIPG